ncbi:MAG: PilZ domain-containing protein [Candidatus Aminicenantes bacterium]|nr:PilZ domain-containing protein [Candidatus Aminicenantes bacterium]
MSKLKLKIARSKKKPEQPILSEPKERRQYPRVEVNLKARSRIPDRSFHEVMVQNIGAGGMCLLLDHKVAPKLIIELEFKLPDGGKELIHSYAEVIWQSNSHTGIKFISM